MAIKFENFLESPIEYQASEEFWAEKFKAILSERVDSPKWQRWFEPKFADGTSFGDGNPIFNQVCWQDRKAVLIIQQDPKEFPPEHLCAWMQKWGDDGELDQLTIGCTLTDNAERVSTRLLKAYVVEGLSAKQMNARISDFVR